MASELPIEFTQGVAAAETAFHLVLQAFRLEIVDYAVDDAENFADEARKDILDLLQFKSGDEAYHRVVELLPRYSIMRRGCCRR